MLLRYSFDMEEDAASIEQAVENVLATAGRTADIAAPGRAAIHHGGNGRCASHANLIACGTIAV